MSHIFINYINSTRSAGSGDCSLELGDGSLTHFFVDPLNDSRELQGLVIIFQDNILKYENKFVSLPGITGSVLVIILL